MMNLQEHLLVCLGEEASEVGQEAAKCLRFGPHDCYNGSTNLERLVTEYSQLEAVRRRLAQAGIVIEVNEEAVQAKLHNLDKYMGYSVAVGTLQSDENLRTPYWLGIEAGCQGTGPEGNPFMTSTLGPSWEEGRQRSFRVYEGQSAA
jgi:hypothetical protein